jgi:hypothetical protein
MDGHFFFLLETGNLGPGMKTHLQCGPEAAATTDLLPFVPPVGFMAPSGHSASALAFVQPVGAVPGGVLSSDFLSLRLGFEGTGKA